MLRAAVIGTLASTLFVLSNSTTKAQDTSTALSPTRIKLPQGPGSLEGVGENAEAQLNQGQVSYGVPLAVPAGQQGLTPSLGLHYSSSGGASVVGLGWSLGGVSCIERMTSRGLPEYDAADLFATDSGAELARVTGGSPTQRIYRERMEASFSRYTWFESGAGTAGYWKVESADGRVSYFGARANGKLVPEARLLGRGGAVFAYYLTETVDPFGHRIVYDYVLDGGRPYLTQVSWGFESFDVSAPARYRATLVYEPRPDVLTDAKPGAVVRLTQRLAALRVTVSGALLRRYALAYESGGMSGGHSRLQSVRTFGMDDVTMNPIVFSFRYTRGLDPTCMTSGGPTCVRPARHSVGSIGADLRNNNVDFLDMNGDALPDAVNTAGGNHSIALQHLSAQGRPSFAPTITSALSASGSDILSSPHVELLDLDGDGRSDLVDRLNAHVLRNGGTTGDWRTSEALDTHMPNTAVDADARFLDVDYDHEIDVLHMSSSGAWYYENLGNGQFAQSATSVSGLGIGFTTGGLKLADMNGDGMPDAVQFPSAGSVWYYPNLGYGEFGDAVVLDGVPIGWDATTTDLVDVSGDGLTDIVRVIGGTIDFALNLDATRFGALVTVLDTHVEGGLPSRVPGTTSIRFLDMNANGTTDVVYVSPSGFVEYVELYSEKPNLLAEIHNGIGKDISLEYGTIAEQMARDGGATAWARLLPNPMVVLTKITLTDARTHVPQVQEMYYRNGYWDAEEHQFRGFEEVWVKTPGDAYVETGDVLSTFDVGASDRYHRGLAVRTETRSNGRVLSIVVNEWENCVVAQAASVAGSHPVRFVCSPRKITDVIEGLSAAETVRTEEAYQYDGYGNRIVTHKLGVVSHGGQGCTACARDTSSIQGEPCGQMCVGDEAHEVVDFVVPGGATAGRWLLHAAWRKRSFGIEGSPEVAEERTYYDGAAFVGVDLANLTHGIVHRIEQKRATDVDAWRPSLRADSDTHGNLVTTMDGAGHRRSFAYDGAGLLVRHEQTEFDDAGHAPYALRMSVAYHPVLEQVISSSSWMRLESNTVVSNERNTNYAYDALGRIVAIAEPGDSLSTPTQELTYEIAAPISRIILRRRTVSGSPQADLELVQCFDGLGRKYQDRARVGVGRYQVDGIALYDSQGQAFRDFQPYLGSSGSCDAGAPSENTLATTSRRDALHRIVELVHPDEEDLGSNSVERTLYRPLTVEHWAAEDNEVGNPHENTPERDHLDGLGRLVRRERTLHSTEAPVTMTLSYDALGRLRSAIDDAGNEQRQHYDLLGRTIEVNHPEAGRTTFTYDDANNQTARVDGRGVSVRYAYDEANRVTSSWNPDAPLATLTTYRYDGNCGEPLSECANGEGMLVSVEHSILGDQRAIERIARDARSREVRRTVQRGSRRYVFANTFDASNRAIGRSFPDGTTLAFELDGVGRLRGVPGYIESVGYEDRGEVSEIVFANGATTTRNYDARKRLSELRTRLPGQRDEALALRLHWDRAGDLSTVADDVPRVDSDASLSASYEYDALHRLTIARLDPDRDREEELTYRPDRIDNLLSITSTRGEASPAHIGEMRYGEGDAGPRAVTSVGGGSYAYDDAGHVVSRLGLTHEWDHLGRLTESRSDTGTVTQTAYSADWTRTEQAGPGYAVEYIAEDYEVRNGIAAIYVLHGGRPLATIERSTTAVREMPDLVPDGRIDTADAWMWNAHEKNLQGLNGLSAAPPSGPQVATDTMLAASARRLLLGDDASATTYQHADHLGTVVVETDESAEITQTATAYPYGTPRSFGGSEWSRFGHTGMERDSETGLELHGARWLDTRTGRWLSPDPYFEKLTPDRNARLVEAVAPMTYAMARPSYAVDPSGLAAGASPDQSVPLDLQMRYRWMALATAELRASVSESTEEGRRAITQYMREAGVGAGPANLPTETHWCASFVGAMLRRAGVEGLPEHMPGAANWRNMPGGTTLFASSSSTGERLTSTHPSLEPGAVIVFYNPSHSDSATGNHATFIVRTGTVGTGPNARHYVDVLGGNQNNKVNIQRRFLDEFNVRGVVMPGNYTDPSWYTPEDPRQLRSVPEPTTSTPGPQVSE